MEEMKKLVLKLDLHDDKQKQKAMMAVSGLSGVDSISVDMKERKLTVIGDIDPVTVVSKLRKNWPSTEIVSVGLAKEPEKKKKGGKKDDGKKDEGKKDDGKKEKGKKDDGKEGGKKDKGKKEEGKKDDGKKEEGKKDDGKKKEGKKDDGKKKEGKKDDGKEDGKKDNGKEGKKGDGKKKDPNQQYLEFMKTYGPRAPAYMPYYVHNVEENPNTCVIS